MDLDFKACDDRFKRLFNLNFENRNYPASIEKCFLDYEQGFIEEEIFISELQALSEAPIAKSDLLDSWNAMLVEIPRHRLEFLLELRKSYKVFLLSNTNFTHIHWVHQYLNEIYQIQNFEDSYFDKVYYSHQVKMRKPNYNIYEHVLLDARLKGSESLFVDDTLENIVAAQELGIHAALHKVSEDIVVKLPDYIRQIE